MGQKQEKKVLARTCLPRVTLRDVASLSVRSQPVRPPIPFSPPVSTTPSPSPMPSVSTGSAVQTVVAADRTAGMAVLILFQDRTVGDINIDVTGNDGSMISDLRQV